MRGRISCAVRVYEFIHGACCGHSNPLFGVGDIHDLGRHSDSSGAAKVALFRRLFVGRIEVFPIRWENRKTSKGGYAPACANEWVKGMCNKPHLNAASEMW